MIQPPLLRHGKPCKSLYAVRTAHYQTGEEFVELSQANPGLIRRDLMDQPAAKADLARIPVAGALRASHMAVPSGAPANRIVWERLHEGNLFEHLYGRLAFQQAPELTFA